MSETLVRIGTRGSELARTQTGTVAAMLAAATGVSVETIIIKTEGDRIQDVPLHQVEGKGFFTKEIEEALLEERIDLAVHSLKDLPVDSPAGLVVAAIPVREMANDLLLVREDVAVASHPLLLPPEAVVGTSSKRRALQMKVAHPGTVIKELRGNVPTRIRKLTEGAYDAILLAAAGFRRLGIEAAGYRTVVLDYDAMLPAPGQGALALQVRAADARLVEIAGVLHDVATARAVEAERCLLQLLGGGCGMPLGVFAESVGEAMRMRAVLGPESWGLHDAPEWVRAVAEGDSAEAVARGVFEQFGVGENPCGEP